MTLPDVRTQSNPATGTWHVAPSWITDTQDGGWGYWRAVNVATGETVHEADDLAALVAYMAWRHPHLAMAENAYTLSLGGQVTR